MFIITAVLLCLHVCYGGLVWDNDGQHPVADYNKNTNYGDYINSPDEAEKTDWFGIAQNSLDNANEQARRLIDLHHSARNGIFMMGDGLGMSTVTAGRVFMSQLRNITGEEAVLSWEDMPYMALSKTYSSDYLVPDSANTATAMMCGEKSRKGIVCSNQFVKLSNCSSMQGNTLKSILHHAIEAGKWTGIVTTDQLPGASVASNFAHAPDRNWFSDADIPEDEKQCKDIAAQLTGDEINHNIRVIFGGGRKHFLPNNETDPEYPDQYGRRQDGRNLINEWMNHHESSDPSQWAYVNNLDSFNNINVDQVEYVLGLFEPEDMKFEHDRQQDQGTWQEPSLTEMVEKALQILSRGPNGFFLFVEGSNIDSAHHKMSAFHSLKELVSLHDAVAKVKEMTSEEDTLVVVSSDHSHVFTIAGYPALNTPILEYNDEWERDWGFQYGEDGKPYTTLGYSNGPGYYYHNTLNGSLSTWQPRKNLEQEKEKLSSPEMLQDANVPLNSETHGGEDVPIYARGPMSYLFQGGQEQTFIAHAMNYAMCIGPNKEMCEDPPAIVDPCALE